MGTPIKEMAGLRFGRLLVRSRHGHLGYGRPAWLCDCDCGGTSVVAGGNLRAGLVRSCGCLLQDNGSRPKHGNARDGLRTTEHRIWAGMLQRCRNPKNNAWRNYGGRGIAVCERWSRFVDFLADMGRRPTAAHSLDRIDNDGPYSPENCRWADKATQIKNSRMTNVTVEKLDLLRVLLAARRTHDKIAEELGISKATVGKWKRQIVGYHPSAQGDRGVP
jgi:hypothetical protein